MPLCRSEGHFFKLLSCFLIFVFFASSPGTLSSAQLSSSNHTFDGPAELPRISLATSMADTPAPGKSRLVKSSDDLQQAVNQASCGDTLQLEAGATFTGLFRLPQKPCDDSHWIILRTSAPDTNLPPQGTRITPCYAGIGSLAGRPEFHCPAAH